MGANAPIKIPYLTTHPDSQTVRGLTQTRVASRNWRLRQRRHTALLNALIYVATAEYQDPLTFREAMESALADEWKEACQYEIDAPTKMGTWTLVELPWGRRAVKSKWVISTKPMDASVHGW